MTQMARSGISFADSRVPRITIGGAGLPRSLIALIGFASLVLGQVPSWKTDQDVDSRPRFVNKGDQTIMDRYTGLMWADADNGRDFNWEGARRYCDNYRGGGNSDWRLPTIGELETLYDEQTSAIVYCLGDRQNRWIVHIGRPIKLSCTWVWSSEAIRSEVACLSFLHGRVLSFGQDNSDHARVIPVRIAK